MTRETLKALWESIEHWYDNWERAGREEMITYGHRHCALCNLFFYQECEGCPVGHVCTDTPYDYASYKAQCMKKALETDPNSLQSWSELQEACAKEYRFLIDLTPEPSSTV